MIVTPTAIPDVLRIQRRVFDDERGWFVEAWNAASYINAGIDADFVQDNVSYSRRGVLRGLHLQRFPHAQGKLVSVLAGEVFDVAVDVRPESGTFGQWVGETLSAENGLQLYIPPGFAHGFVVMSEAAVFSYKCTKLYAPASEIGFRWDDPEIGIDWPLGVAPIVSPKDRSLPLLKELLQTSSAPL